jgi:hypothetical protein
MPGCETRSFSVRNVFFPGNSDEAAEMALFPFREHNQKLSSGKKHGIYRARHHQGII